MQRLIWSYWFQLFDTVKKLKTKKRLDFFSLFIISTKRSMIVVSAKSIFPYRPLFRCRIFHVEDFEYHRLKNWKSRENNFVFFFFNLNDFGNKKMEYLQFFFYLYRSTVGKTVDRCHSEWASKTQNNGGKSLTSSNREIATKNWNNNIFHEYWRLFRCERYHMTHPIPVAIPDERWKNSVSYLQHFELTSVSYFYNLDEIF